MTLEGLPPCYPASAAPLAAAVTHYRIKYRIVWYYDAHYRQVIIRRGAETLSVVDAMLKDPHVPSQINAVTVRPGRCFLSHSWCR